MCTCKGAGTCSLKLLYLAVIRQGMGTASPFRVLIAVLFNILYSLNSLKTPKPSPQRTREVGHMGSGDVGPGLRD